MTTRVLIFALALILAINGVQSQPSLAPAPADEVSGLTNSSLLAPALAPDAWRNACKSSLNVIYSSQLFNQSETICAPAGGVPTNNFPGRFGRNTDFGFNWQDATPQGCTIFTVTIVVQAGISCTGVPGGGTITLNGKPTSAKYRFPYGNEYGTGSCYCTPVFSPIQVFTISPSNYNQSGFNTFAVLGSTGSNGLRPILSNATGGIYGAVIINQWAPTAPMTVPRTGFGYVTTPRGKALAAGGYETDGTVLASGDEYNSTLATWQPSSNLMQEARAQLEMANLQSLGNNDSSGSYYVVAAGGVAQNGTALPTADLYNTSNQRFGPIKPMRNARVYHQLTSVYNASDRVFATGGYQGSAQNFTPLATAEYYDWDQSEWNLTGDMNHARFYHQTVKLNGTQNMLVTGGRGAGSEILESTEIYDDNLVQFNETTPLNQARFAHKALALTNGSVLVMGGSSLPDQDGKWQESGLLASCEMWDPESQTWTLVKNMTYPRANFQAVLLSDGTIFVAGGGGQNASKATELWNSQTGNWTLAPPMLSSTIDGGIAQFPVDLPVNGGTVLAFGGSVDSYAASINGTTNSGLFTPAFNLTQFTALLAPTMAPALSPDQLVGVTNVDSPSSSSAGGGGIYNIAVSGGGGGLSDGAAAGIAVGICAVVAAVVVLFILWWRRRRRRRRAARAEAQYAHDPKAAGYPAVVAGGASGNTSAQTTRNPSLSTSRSKGGLLMALSSPFAHMLGEKKASKEVPAKEVEDGMGVGMGNGESMHTGGGMSEVSGYQKIMASPFDTPYTATPLSTKGSGMSHQGDLHVSRSGENNPHAHHHSFTPSSVADEFHASDVGNLPLGTRFSAKSGAGQSQRSDLSRVSMAIKNELHGAEWKIERRNIELGKRLGKGGFGEVFQGKHHGSAVAVKVLEIGEDRMMLQACEEFGHLHSLRHSKLVISYGACVDGSTMLLVMELMEEDLFHAISSDATGRADSALYYFRGWRIAVDIASALVFLHSKGLVHLDVKSLNILLKGGRTEAKLADLGLSKMVPDGQQLSLITTLPGTPAYSAPEVAAAQLQWRLRTQGRRDQFKTEVGTPADIFAFGVVLFEICTGQHPARWRQDFTGEFRKDQAPPAIAQLVDRCLDDEPSKRPTAQEVLDILLENEPGRGRSG